MAKGCCGGLISTRYILAVLGSVGMGTIYGLKVNLHVAIVSMLNHTAIAASTAAEEGSHSVANHEPVCYADSNTTSEHTEDGPFNWSTNIQGILLSAYFWGYLISMIPGSQIAEKVSAKWVMWFAVGINAVCTLLTPLMAKLHFGALLAMRVGEGLGGGVTFPAMHVMLANWAPTNERSVMSSIVYAGTALGTVIFMLVSGLIADGLGWQWVFYIEGLFSCIWLVLWIFCTSDTPATHRYITDEERTFINTSLHVNIDETRTPHRVPFKKVFSSKPFWAILIAHTCSNWGWYMVLIELPLYMKTVLNFKMSENAFLTSLPFLCMWVFSMVLSKILDVLRGRQTITTTTARKISTLFASAVPLVCFLVLCFLGCNRGVAVALMTIAVTGMGGMFSGFLSNHIDIAPKYAGTLMAFTNAVATIPGITVPVVVGTLTHTDPSMASWRIIFWITIVLFAVEIVVYMIFGSGEEQPWNKSEASPEGQPLKPTETAAK